MWDERRTSLVEGMFDATSIADLGPLLLSSPAMSECAKGLAILRLHEYEWFEQLIALGTSTSEGIIPLSVFDDHPAANAIRSESLICGVIAKTKVYAAPIRKHSKPLGVLIVTCSLDPRDPQSLEETLPLLCTLIGRLFSSYFTLQLDSQLDSLDRRPLSPRQIKILELIAEGMTNEQVARTIMISPSTVRQENIKIFRHLGATNRKVAALIAVERGLISSDTLNLEAVGELR
jgi:DNA-binding CsgD family transcriptional regulator